MHMDVATLADLPFVAFLAGAPDYVWAALASALTTLGLATAFAPRRATAAKPDSGRAGRRAATS